MFQKLLIANRGVIACRIIRTLRKMGVQSVAVYSEADRDSRHVSLADEAFCIGEAPAKSSYLRGDFILEVAKKCGAGAIHPGYGFLSENADFAALCEENGVAFVGPTAGQMRVFGPKHSAREIAKAQNVPLLPGSELLSSLEDAQLEAQRIGFPLMLKSTAGGGGIGMKLVNSSEELREAFEAVSRLAQSNFADGGVYLERFVTHARHIEVQIFGDGRGEVVTLGERDCSVQRRNQKVIEETPAPFLSQNRREQLLEAALKLGRAVNYRSAGTVEFVFDAERDEFYFLEVNTRLQVEHGVTEQVTGVDLVEWMVRLAQGSMPELKSPMPRGHSIQARIYAEDPALDFRPCAGRLTRADFPEDALARVESWVEAGTQVPPFYDPMLAKIIVTGADRDDATAKLARALDKTRLAGIETNVAYLRQIARDEGFTQNAPTTKYLSTLPYCARGVEVLEAGIQTTIQDWPGRLGFWNVGVPPSGPMDDLAPRLANGLLGNPGGAAVLECTAIGPTLRFRHATTIALGGADMNATLDEIPLAPYQTRAVAAGSILKMGAIHGAGARAYVAIEGGFAAPEYLGSQATFTLGNFGGHDGRALRVGDVLPVSEAKSAPASPSDIGAVLPTGAIPTLTNHWEIGVLYGPHGAPDFFTDSDIETFFSTDYEVHYNSSRTGVRLVGPKPNWARADGGEAGLHPSNIHDNAYAIGAIDFTGDTPIILGPDGPSLGGFVCPACVASAELWKIGQLKAGDKVRFVPISIEATRELLEKQDALVQSANLQLQTPNANLQTQNVSLQSAFATARESPVLETRPALSNAPEMAIRQAGDAYLLVEYGPVVLDFNLRFRVQALFENLTARKIPGVLDLTPGIRSLQLHFDPRKTTREAVLAAINAAEDELEAVDEEEIEVESRVVFLPLSWDDPQTRLAIERYQTSVRPDAPWCPSNIEFIRRINGLDSIDEVQKIVFEASYLVLGLGDVYLGAPVATPLDPRHRLVTTKYNPARTWTPENAVGIGGAYLCIYGMEGPGGYQFVGRTLPVWNTFRATQDFEKGRPWLLRFFDQIRFYPVSASELLEMRADFRAGRHALKIENTRLRLRDLNAFSRDNADSIAAFKARQQAAFEAEREAWKRNGQAEYQAEIEAAPVAGDDLEAPEGGAVLGAPTSGMVWKILAPVGSQVRAGDTILILEAMKTEFAVLAPFNGEVLRLACNEGQGVTAGQKIVVVSKG